MTNDPVAEASADPLVLVTSDAHIGPLLGAQLREYCPRRHLGAFDEYVASKEAYFAELARLSPDMFLEVEPGVKVRGGRNRLTKGHHDMAARLKDMNYDGVAGEVLFHGSQNDEPLPFTNLGDPKHPSFFKNDPPDDPELATVGRHMYNAWLADVCSLEPERHVGLAQIPIWDVEASIREIEWARDAGLRGVNFPSPQPWFPAEYNKPIWEPLWEVAEALEMPLVTHTSAGSDADYTGVDGRAINAFEVGFFGRRGLQWMIFGGVFERHPRLRLVLTEFPGNWWPSTIADLDSQYRMQRLSPTSISGSGLAARLPKLPSEYCRENVFVGASFMSHLEAQSAADNGYYPNYMWGSDYPHMEGTFVYPDSWDEPPVTHVALNFAFSGVDPDKTRLMVGQNAIKVYGLDGDKLRTVAERINAPTSADLVGPIDTDLDMATSMAFRRSGTYD